MKKKKTLKNELARKEFRVTIFGSARIKRGTREYKKIFNLAKVLGSKGIDIVTGGGPGLMEAANAGHQAGRKNKKTHSIGLNIKLSREQHPNKSLDVMEEFKTFSKRLDNFMKLSNAVVISPGGVGTLLEFFYTWQLVQVKKICDIPIILLGREYPSLISWIKKNPLKKGYISPEDMNPLYIAKTSKDASKHILKVYEDYHSKEKVCINSKKYKTR